MSEHGNGVPEQRHVMLEEPIHMSSDTIAPSIQLDGEQCSEKCTELGDVSSQSDESSMQHFNASTLNSETDMSGNAGEGLLNMTLVYDKKSQNKNNEERDEDKDEKENEDEDEDENKDGGEEQVCTTSAGSKIPKQHYRLTQDQAAAKSGKVGNSEKFQGKPLLFLQSLLDDYICIDCVSREKNTHIKEELRRGLQSAMSSKILLTQTHLSKAYRVYLREKLSNEETKSFAARMQTCFGWDDDSHPFQLAGVKAQLEGDDMIIQAPTESGKTAIVARPYIMTLQDEMVKTFEEKFKLTAVTINSTHGIFTPGLDVLAGKYQVILILLEMLQSQEFIKRILTHQYFTLQVLSMVVDEAHCVSHWGANFCKKYASLGTVCAFLPRGTPVVTVTAMLTRHVHRDLFSKLNFT
ncbi:hypothetical protein NM688_g4416 [Phlebia brevispora]|uniref:Uncharacterized protein n=1 Tax=Phlebia brevispora TaxID=194682 RepID=A0ACC1T355_9APHY|nr:hypothetical protein NM688_g4416 [Phlebia brevispora]